MMRSALWVRTWLLFTRLSVAPIQAVVSHVVVTASHAAWFASAEDRGDRASADEQLRLLVELADD